MTPLSVQVSSAHFLDILSGRKRHLILQPGAAVYVSEIIKIEEVVNGLVTSAAILKTVTYLEPLERGPNGAELGSVASLR